MKRGPSPAQRQRSRVRGEIRQRTASSTWVRYLGDIVGRSVPIVLSMMVRRPVTVVFEGAVAEPPLVEQQAAACGLRHDEAGQPVDSAGEKALGAGAEVGVAIPRQQADVVDAGLQLQQCITAGVNTIDRTHAVIV